MILLPLFPQELAFVRKAMRALSVSGDERDIRINIEASIDRCHQYPDTVGVIRLIEQAAFQDD